VCIETLLNYSYPYSAKLHAFSCEVCHTYGKYPSLLYCCPDSLCGPHVYIFICCQKWISFHTTTFIFSCKFKYEGIDLHCFLTLCHRMVQWLSCSVISAVTPAEYLVDECCTQLLCSVILDTEDCLLTVAILTVICE
jgi:hypothetical protein